MTCRLSFRGLLAVSLALVSALAFSQQPVTITILHLNDLHAHVEPTKIRGKEYGGYARLATLIQRYKKSDPNPILLSAGDTFQGTMYFNVYEGLADLAFMNYVGFQAMAVGNHEFDKGPATLATFAKQANFPLLAANLDVSDEPALRDLIRPSMVIDVAGMKVGIVGAITSDLLDISSPGERIKMLDLVTSIQKAVDQLTSAGINKIILLTHVGYLGEQQLAATIKDVDVIVGGHSHTPLGLPKIDGFPDSAGDYPTVVKGANGQQVLVVQAWEWGKVFGRLRVRFDRNGRIESFMADKPIVVDESVPEDPVMKSMIAAFQKPLAATMNQVVGEATGPISRSDEGKNTGANPMGDLIADATMAEVNKNGVDVAFVNRGGVRANLEAGKITYGAAISVQPFGNTIVLLDVRGSELLEAFEQTVAGYPERGGGILQPSKGTSYTIDVTKPAGQRISNVVIAGHPLDPNKTYKIAVNSFSAAGGDGIIAFKDAKGKRVDTGIVDIDAFVNYIKANTPLKPSEDKRIQMITPPLAELVEWLHYSAFEWR